MEGLWGGGCCPDRCSPGARSTGRTASDHIWDHPRVPQADTSRAPADEPAHDILAAEAFGVPAPDPELNHPPVVLPSDPSGIQEPHDILAAEEFAMPAVKPHSDESLNRRARTRRRLTIGAAAGALIGFLAFRRRRG
jgi:hypothetical protein